MTNAERPAPRDLAWRTLKCLEGLGGCASIEQIVRCLAEFLSTPEDIVRYPAGWARTYLKKVGAVDNPSRGIWCITNSGRRVRDERALLDAIKRGTQLPGSIDPSELPTTDELVWPTLTSLKDLGGIATIKQLSQTLAQVLRIRPELLQILHGDGSLSEFNYRALCARTSLKSISAIVEDASNGMWHIADVGRRIPDEETLLKMLRGEEDEREQDSNGWRNELLNLLRSMKHQSFVSLCKQVLIESGFRQLEVTN